jgi:hypothetical protein
MIVASTIFVLHCVGTDKTSNKAPDPETPPAETQEGAEIFYDDGQMDLQHSPWSDLTGGQLAVVFTPPYYPVKLIKVRFFVGIFGFPKTEFRVRVYGGTIDDGPDESQDLLHTRITASALIPFRWVEVDLTEQDISIEKGDFCVAMEWLTAPGDEGKQAQFLGVDIKEPDGRSWWKTHSGSKWKKLKEVANIGDRDLMIRALVKPK